MTPGRGTWPDSILNCRGWTGSVHVLSAGVCMAAQLAKTLWVLIRQCLFQRCDQPCTVLLWSCLLCPHRPDCAEPSAPGWQEWWVVPEPGSWVARWNLSQAEHLLRQGLWQLESQRLPLPLEKISVTQNSKQKKNSPKSISNVPYEPGYPSSLHFWWLTTSLPLFYVAPRHLRWWWDSFPCWPFSCSWLCSLFLLTLFLPNPTLC